MAPTPTDPRQDRYFLHCVSCLALWYWMQSFCLDPLRESGAEMAHLDPTDIISVPYPVEGLGTFVGVTYVVSFLVFTEWWEPKILLLELLRTVQGTVLCYGLQILCGAQPVHNVIHTLWSSLYITTLACPRATTQTKKDGVWLFPQLLQPTTVQVSHVGLDAARLYGTLLVAIPFQVLHILDWGAQVQRWPLPVLIGCTYGCMVGTLGGTALIFLRKNQNPSPANAATSSTAAVTKRIS